MKPQILKELPVPCHYDLAKVGEVWRVPYPERSDKAEQWATQHGIRSSAEDSFRVSLLLVDVSPVVVPGIIDYTESADVAFRRFADAGMHIVRSTDPMSSWPGLQYR
jgi:hypothetical protein